MEFSTDPNLSPCGSNPVRPVALTFNLCPSVGLYWLIRYYPALITIPNTNLHPDYKHICNIIKLIYFHTLGASDYKAHQTKQAFLGNSVWSSLLFCRSSLSFLHFYTLDSLLLKSLAATLFPHSTARLIALSSKSTLHACLLADAILRSLYTHTIILC